MLIAPQITWTTRKGKVEVVQQAVLHERLYGLGETLTLVANEALYLIENGSTVLPGGAPIYPT